MSLKNLLPLIFLFQSVVLFSQEKSKDEYGRDIKDLTLKKRGPNLDRYSHLFLSFGFIIGDSEGDSAKIISGKSSAFSVGWRFKWRMAKWYELGFDVAYQYSSFHLKQDSSKIVPTKRLHKSEKIVFNRVEVVPFQRFKLKNKYHSTGTFLDLGGFLGYNYRIKNQTLETNHNPGAGQTKVVNLDLNYTENINYGLLARLGRNRTVIYARYRLSNLFKKTSGLPELPRFDVGISLGLHQ